MSLLKKIDETRHLAHGAFDTKLTVTDEMIRQARGNKFSFIATINPREFLKLTTSGNMPPDYFKEQCKTLDQYNQWAHEGESIIMPALWIKKEKVVGHEGRHRAAALICAGHDKMPVAVRLYPQDEHEEKYGYWEAPYEMKYEDMERAIHGEYGSGIVMRSAFKPVIDGWNNLQSNVTEASLVHKNVASIADMYEKWRDEINLGKRDSAVKPNEMWVTDAGYNGLNNPPIAYTNVKVMAKSEQDARDKVKDQLLHGTSMRVPYTNIDVLGEVGSQAFFDEHDAWFVSVSYS